MYTVEGKLKGLNANVLQPSLPKLCPAREHGIGGESQFFATSVLITHQSNYSVLWIKR